MTPEGKVKQKVKEMLERVGAWYFMPVPSIYQATTVDFICCVKGQFVAIEAKRPGKEATTRQAFVLERIRENGGMAYVINSQTDIDFVEQALRDIP